LIRTCILAAVGVPDAPKSVELTESMPDGVVLTIEPPDEDGGMPVIGYRVRYGDDVRHDVTASGTCFVVNNVWPWLMSLIFEALLLLCASHSGILAYV